MKNNDNLITLEDIADQVGIGRGFGGFHNPDKMRDGLRSLGLKEPEITADWANRPAVTVTAAARIWQAYSVKRDAKNKANAAQIAETEELRGAMREMEKAKKFYGPSTRNVPRGM